MLGFGLSTITLTILFFARKPLTGFFTTNAELAEIVSRTLMFVAAVEFFGNAQAWLQGIIKGLGMFKQAVVGLLL